jgi:predicted nucleic acid-binding protein
MIILDTNVVSEPLRRHPDPHVLEWLDRQAPATLYLTTINIAELWAGIEVLPAGRRRMQLHNAMANEILPLFEGRVLSFDPDAAVAFDRVFSGARAAGNSMDFADCAIAAIAAVHRFILATRNSKDFKGSDVELLDPWEPAE